MRRAAGSPGTSADPTGGDAEEGSALDLLEREDVALRQLFDEIRAPIDESVPERFDHGNKEKQLIRRVAVREAAKADVIRVLGGGEDTADLCARFEGKMKERRGLFDRLDQMSHGVTGIDLNRAQPFESVLEDLYAVVAPELEWELADGIPAVRRLATEGRLGSLRDAHFVLEHAPSHLHVNGLRWYEHMRVVSWVMARVNRLGDRPLPPGSE